MAKKKAKNPKKTTGRPPKYPHLRARVVVALRTLRSPSGRTPSTTKKRGVDRDVVSFSEIRKDLGAPVSNRILKVACSGLLRSRKRKRRTLRYTPFEGQMTQEQFRGYSVSQRSQGW